MILYTFTNKGGVWKKRFYDQSYWMESYVIITIRWLMRNTSQINVKIIVFQKNVEYEFWPKNETFFIVCWIYARSTFKWNI